VTLFNSAEAPRCGQEQPTPAHSCAHSMVVSTSASKYRTGLRAVVPAVQGRWERSFCACWRVRVHTHTWVCGCVCARVRVYSQSDSPLKSVLYLLSLFQLVMPSTERESADLCMYVFMYVTKYQ
jgi:hypothetical protein